MDNSTNNKNIFQSELPCEKKNGHSIIQEFINNYPYGVQDLIYNPQIEMFARFKMKSSFHKTKRII